MNNTTLMLGFLAQALSVEPAALEKRLLDIFLKIDDTLRSVETALGGLVATLPAPPVRGGGGTPGAAAPAGATPGGLLPPTLLAALPPLQTLDMAFGALLEKREPGIRACLQLQAAAEKAINSTEVLTVALDAVAVAERGLGNLLATGRVDGGPGLRPGAQLDNAEPKADAAPQAAATTGLPRHNAGGAPGPAIIGAKNLGPRPVYYSGATEATHTPPTPGGPAAPPVYTPQVADSVATGILDYLARFEPLLQGLEKKSTDALQYIISMDNNLGRMVAGGITGEGSSGNRVSPVTSGLANMAFGVSSGAAVQMLLKGLQLSAGPVALLAAYIGILILALSEIDFDRLFSSNPEPDKKARFGRIRVYNKFYAEREEGTLNDYLINGPHNSKRMGERPSPKPKFIPPLAPPLSPLDAIPPQTLTNITNNYYDNCNNQSITNHIQDTSPEAFARSLQRELRHVVNDFDSGMHV